MCVCVFLYCLFNAQPPSNQPVSEPGYCYPCLFVQRVDFFSTSTTSSSFSILRVKIEKKLVDFGIFLLFFSLFSFSFSKTATLYFSKKTFNCFSINSSFFFYFWRVDSSSPPVSRSRDSESESSFDADWLVKASRMVRFVSARRL